MLTSYFPCVAGCKSKPGSDLDPSAVWGCTLPATHGDKCTAACNGTAAPPNPPTVVCDFGENTHMAVQIMVHMTVQIAVHMEIDMAVSLTEHMAVQMAIHMAVT